MTKQPPAPPFNPFRPRVRVPLNPSLTLLCYAPTVDDGLKAERIIEASNELQEHPDEARSVAIADEALTQLWSLVVGVDVLDEEGKSVPTPKDWREQLWREGTLADEFGAQAWTWLFRRQLARVIGRAEAGRGGRGAGPGKAGGSSVRKRHGVPMVAKAVPNPRRSMRAVS